MTRETITFQVQPDFKRELRIAAAYSNTSVSDFIRQSLEKAARAAVKKQAGRQTTTASAQP